MAESKEKDESLTNPGNLNFSMPELGRSKSKSSKSKNSSKNSPGKNSSKNSSKNKDKLAVSTSNETDISSANKYIKAISKYTKKMTDGKIDFAKRIAEDGDFVNDLLVGSGKSSDSTLFFRTTVSRLVIPIKTLSKFVTAKPFDFTQKLYESKWQLYTLDNGFDGSAGNLVKYTPFSCENFFNVDKITTYYNDILLSICRANVISTALNPGGKKAFSTAKIVVRHNLAKDALKQLKTAVGKRFPGSKGKITYLDNSKPAPSGHVLVFVNIFSNFEIWQKGSAGTAEHFKPSVTPSSLTAKVSNAQMDAMTLTLTIALTPTGDRCSDG